mmetsp:Transcript_71939/g.153774  ORF Transcript_71939/g.153774 Transcript_71939/m.153774 type:complete len:83 (+) Transcript_71939:105-353(+)
MHTLTSKEEHLLVRTYNAHQRFFEHAFTRSCASMVAFRTPVLNQTPMLHTNAVPSSLSCVLAYTCTYTVVQAFENACACLRL